MGIFTRNDNKQYLHPRQHLVGEQSHQTDLEAAPSEQYTAWTQYAFLMANNGHSGHN